MATRRQKPDVRLDVARYRIEQLAPERTATVEDDDTALTGQQSMDARAQFVEINIQQAMRRGEFDHLPGAGAPLTGLTEVHDPDWWIRRKIEREKLTGLGPPALSLRTEDVELDGRLDAAASERAVRELLDDFNRRVVEARRQLLGGPPVITKTRNVEAELARWRDRRTARLAARQDSPITGRAASRVPAFAARFRRRRHQLPVD